MQKNLERVEKNGEAQLVPSPVEGSEDLVQVDATWGSIQSMQVAEGVRTVGELEVKEHLEQELPAVDSRDPCSFERTTIPGAQNLPFTEAGDRVDELDRQRPTVFFCNGP